MSVTPPGGRQLEPAVFRRAISVARRGDESSPALLPCGALLRRAFGRATG
ncbi:hypothetical protein ABZY19_26110 [Streptomyces sp. NPDC006475]